MSAFLPLMARHGYSIIFLIALLEAIGLPVPAALALVAGGAAAASGILSAPLAVLIAVVAMLLGDSLLYLLGRYLGWGLLGYLCKVSANPETCILRSAESFYKRGRTTLLLAKFIPGVNTMAPPLAGSMRMPFVQFLGLDLVGANFYALAYGAIGFLFRNFLAAIARSFQEGGTRDGNPDRWRCGRIHSSSPMELPKIPRLPSCATGSSDRISRKATVGRIGEDPPRRRTQPRLL